jgi:hypothetical protein
MRCAVALCCTVAFTACSAIATTNTATSYSTWNTPAYITGNPTLLDLDSLNAGTSYNTAAGLNDAGYIFTGPDGSTWSLQAQSFGNATGLVGGSDANAEIEVYLPGSGSNAFLFNANIANGGSLAGGSLTLTLSDGEKFNISSGQFGVSISHDVTWFTLAASSGQAAPFLQYLYFGNSSLTQDGSGAPQSSEAATLALVGGGLLITFGVKRKFTNKFAV